MSRVNSAAATLIFVSAALHLLAPLMAGFSAQSMPLLILAALYLLLGWLVKRNKRWAKWLGFLLLSFGGIAALSALLGDSTTPAWINLAIWLADWAAVICLFVVLWRDHGVETSA